MKNNYNMISLLRTAAFCCAVAVMGACGVDDFTRTAGEIPGDTELTTVSGVLRREVTPEQVSMLKTDEAKPTTDAIFIQLNQPAATDITFSVDADATLVNEFNKGQAVKLALFPLDKVSFPAGKSLTVAKGQKVSGKLIISLSREGVAKGMYLLPLRATINNGAAQSTGKGQILYYRVVVSAQIPATDLDAYPFKVVTYLNTEEMNPLYGNVWTATTFDADFNEITLTWIDLEILRKATVKLEKATGRALLDLGVDLQYVLSNRDTYILPLQRASRKVLFCVTGGNMGLGFCNMSDSQITDFVYQLKYVVDTYQLDGVNFFDMEAGYDKDGAPAIVPASYAKLIKATKEALGDKLVTIACDKESNELLATAQDGIEVGKYIDYAWSGIFNEVVDAYLPGSKLKPLAGLTQSKYGGSLLRILGNADRDKLRPTLIPNLKLLYRETSSANVFAFWDIPTNSAGDYEGGPRDTFDFLMEAMTDWDFEYDGKILTMNTPDFGRNYGFMKKDW